MNRYCVAVVDLFENEVNQQIILAASEYEAAKSHPYLDGVPEQKSLEDLQDVVFDMDRLLSVIEIPT